VVNAVGRQAAARASLPRTARVGRLGPSEYRPLLAALPVGAAIVAGMALNLAPLMAGAVLAACVAAVVSPPVGLAILALMAPLKPPPVIPAPGFNAVLVGATLLGCVYRLPIDRPALRTSAPLLLLLGFVLYVSVQQVPEMLSGYLGAEGHLVGYQFGQVLTLAGLVVASAYVLRGRRPWPFVGAALLSAVVAAVVAIATFDHPAAGPLGNLVGVSDAGSRAVGPFGDPNYFGLFEATAIASGIVWLAVARSWGLRLLLLGASMMMAFAFAIALSRGASIALLAGLAGLAFTRSRRAGVIAVAAAIVVATLVYPLYVDWRVTVDSGGPSAYAYAILAQSDQGRLGAALAGPQLFASSPVFGIGFGHYSFMSGQYVGIPIAAHDWYLNVLAEQGIVGIALWIPMLASIAIALSRTSRSARSVGYAVLVTYMVGSAFLEPPNSVQTSAFAVIVIVAALVGNWADVGADGTPSRQAGGSALEERALQSDT
jgi:O-Antigen ligase